MLGKAFDFVAALRIVNVRGDHRHRVDGSEVDVGAIVAEVAPFDQEIAVRVGLFDQPLLMP